MNVVMDIINAPIAAMWWTLIQWWFWAAALPAAGIVLAVMYRRELAQGLRRAGSNDRRPGHRKGQS